MLTANTRADQISNQAGKASVFSVYDTMEALNQTLREQKPGDGLVVMEYIKDLEKARDKFCTLYKHKPQELFACLYDFLNYDLKQLARGKFYNTASKFTYQEYAKSETSEQFLNNMIRPDTALNIESAGGDCLHWAIFLKKFIDSWHIAGLKSCLIKYTNGTHTFVLVNFAGKSYKAEIAGKNDCFISELGEPLILDKEMPLEDNVRIIVKARGKKDILKQRFVDKHGRLHNIVLTKEEIVLGLNGEEISFKLGNINAKDLQALDAQGIIDYLIAHATIISQNLKRESIKDVLAIAKEAGNTMNKQYLIDLFE